MFRIVNAYLKTIVTATTNDNFLLHMSKNRLVLSRVYSSPGLKLDYLSYNVKQNVETNAFVSLTRFFQRGSVVHF